MPVRGCPWRLGCDAPLLATASVAGSGFLAEVNTRRLDGRVAFDVYPAQHLVALILEGQPGRLEGHCDGGCLEQASLRAGQVLVLPAAQRWQGRSEGVGTRKTVRLLLDPGFLARAAGDPEPTQLEVRRSLDLPDAVIRHSLRALAQEVERPGPLGRLSVECLALSVASRIARHHAVRPRPACRLTALAGHRMRRVTDYIEAHLDEDLPVLTLAREAGLSPVHFARQFRQMTGLPPHQYVMRRRTERAAELLATRGGCIMDTALSVGFSSQAHLTMVFHRVYGMTPARYRALYRTAG